MNVVVKVKLRISIVDISEEHVKISDRIKTRISYVENNFKMLKMLIRAKTMKSSDDQVLVKNRLVNRDQSINN